MAIHTIVGWGLSDVVPNDLRINFLNIMRYNENEYFQHLKKLYSYSPHNDSLYREVKHLNDIYKKRNLIETLVLRERDDANLKNEIAPKSINPFTYDIDYGEDNILVVTPVHMLDWKVEHNYLEYARENMLTETLGPRRGFSRVYEFSENPFPYNDGSNSPPEEIIRLSDFFDIFTENVYKDMKPMLYTYWS